MAVKDYWPLDGWNEFSVTPLCRPVSEERQFRIESGRDLSGKCMATVTREKGTIRSRPLLGAHMSIAGGVTQSLGRGDQIGCQCIQIFTRSSRQWAAKPYPAEEIEAFRSARRQSGIEVVVAHDSYLINLGAPDEKLRKKSIDTFIDELNRCEALEVPFLISHPGAHMGAGEAAGIKTIADSIDEAHKACSGYNVSPLAKAASSARVSSRWPASLTR